MIDHPQGATGAVTSILATKDSFLPPTINYGEPDPECDLNYIPNRGLAKEVELVLCKPEGDPRRSIIKLEPLDQILFVRLIPTAPQELNFKCPTREERAFSRVEV